MTTQRPHALHRLSWPGLLIAAALACGVARAQPAPEPPPVLGLREEVVRIPVTVKDLYNRAEPRQIPLTLYRPAGDGPFPLAVFNHGRATTDRRAQQGRSRPENLAWYLVRKGFVVVAPTRVGYGETFGDFDPETSGPCGSMQAEPMSIAASDQVIAAVEFARTQAYVDASRWIVLGASVGGLTSVATVWRHPPGLVGGINFAGGAGGDPDRRPADPCGPAQLRHLWGSKAREARAPMLWLYWQNDLYWGADHPKTWAQAWIDGGGKAQFHQLPAVGKDGHAGLNIDMDHWVPLVDTFLASLGFDKPGLPQRPPVSGFAAVGEIDKVPITDTLREGFYQRFLEAKPPRAFAIGARGAVGWGTGDWALGKALNNCERRGDSCRLYAVDDDVVWDAR